MKVNPIQFLVMILGGFFILNFELISFFVGELRVKSYLLLIVIAVCFISCQSEDADPDLQTPNPPIEKIVYRELGNQRLAYNSPVYLDVNQDSKIDFVFTSAFLGGGVPHHLQYKLFPANGNQTLISELDVALLHEGDPIGPERVFEKLNIEPMVVKTITEDHIEWSGLWLDIHHQYIGINFTVINEQGNTGRCYGWIRVSFNRALEQLIIHDLAYAIKPGEKIVAGQKK